MPSVHATGVIAAVLVCLSLVGTVNDRGRHSTPAPAIERTVALTFDDIPLGQGQPGTRCNREALLAVNQRITAALTEVMAPSAAFITTGNVCDQLRSPVLNEVVQIWERAGSVIGNHGHRHLSLSRVPLGEYIADLSRADSLIRLASPGYRNGDSRWLRHPFLHVGADRATAAGLEGWLHDHQFAVAPVTIDNNEWVYARAYTLALGRNDTGMMDRLTAAYLQHIDQAFAFAESMSVRVVGEEIPQVLLLHANELNRDHIGDVLQVIRRRGYQFIPLEEALSHPAYRRPIYYYGTWGISWLLRWSPDSTVWRMDLPNVPGWVEQ
jgi:peptidoglycan/xylan/chitin deacetylase (PgdA/CDA1 family)